MSSNRCFSTAAAIFSALLLSGCASIISDSHYPVTMTSQPAGATFIVRNETGEVIHQGTTPGTVTLKAGDGYFSGAHYSVLFQKEGYADQVNSIAPSVDGWYVANILFGGLIGLLIVDPATGAMYKLPEKTSAQLVPSTDGSETLSVITTSALSESEKAQLIRIN